MGWRLFTRRLIVDQAPGADVECLSDFLENEHRGVANAPLDPADIGAMQATFEGELFLRKALNKPVLLQIKPNSLPHVHAERAADLCPIDLQTMSLILLDFGGNVRHFTTQFRGKQDGALSQDIFEFWSQIGRGEHVHPADKTIFNRMAPEQHGFRLDCLPGCFGGRLRDAPLVLLYLSPGFNAADIADAQTEEGIDFYFRRYKGYELPRDLGKAKSSWVTSRTKEFGAWEKVRDKIAVLNIGAYHSINVKSPAMLMALPSSRVSLNWAQHVLFPEAEAGKRIVICMRSAALWGLQLGRTYGQGLFAPSVIRSGHLKKNDQNRSLIKLVQDRLRG